MVSSVAQKAKSIETQIYKLTKCVDESNKISKNNAEICDNIAELPSYTILQSA
ncbi:MAG: hypothetical protein SPG65_03325 [Campylobacter sp.]|nr:hypothetical protein [Campylobacter sp.]